MTHYRSGLKKPRTPAELLALAEQWRDDHQGDPEETHADADYIMAETLTDLGYGDAVEILMSGTRWYA